MKSFLYALIFILYGCGQPQRTTDSSRKNTTKKSTAEKIFKERRKYFVNLDNREVIETFFVFHNSTKKMLSIDTVKAFCNCTKAAYTKNAVKPGETDSICITVNVSKEKVNFSNSAVVYFHGYEPILLEVIGKRKMPESGNKTSTLSTT